MAILGQARSDRASARHMPLVAGRKKNVGPPLEFLGAREAARSPRFKSIANGEEIWNGPALPGGYTYPDNAGPPWVEAGQMNLHQPPR